MIAIVGRNLRLFFSSMSNIVFSLLGALIAFVLYLVFLKNSMDGSLPFHAQSGLLDSWVIGGTLTTAAASTTLGALSQMISDRENGTLADLLMTAPPYWQVQFAYWLSALIVGTVLQLVMAVLMFGYFSFVDRLMVPWMLTGQLLILCLFSSMVWTAFGLLCLSFVQRVETLGKLGTIIGTASGFFAGVYMPIGVVPSAAQTLMKITPAPYDAALYRQLLMKKALNSTFSGNSAEFEKTMGLRLAWRGQLTTFQLWMVLTGFLFLFVLSALLIMKKSRRQRVVRV